MGSRQQAHLACAMKTTEACLCPAVPLLTVIHLFFAPWLPCCLTLQFSDSCLFSALACTQAGAWQRIPLLATLPATELIAATDMEGLMQCALKQPGAVLTELLALPGAQHLEPQQLQRVMLRAVQLHDLDALRELCMLPAAPGLLAEHAEEVLIAAADKGILSRELLAPLLRLPATGDISGAAMHKMLTTAVQDRQAGTVADLLRLEAASEVAPADAAALLLTAASCSCCSRAPGPVGRFNDAATADNNTLAIFRKLCYWGRVQLLGPEDVQPVMARALQHGCSHGGTRLKLMCELIPGTNVISASALESLLAAAVQLPSAQTTAALCKLQVGT